MVDVNKPHGHKHAYGWSPDRNQDIVPRMKDLTDECVDVCERKYCESNDSVLRANQIQAYLNAHALPKFAAE